MAIVKGAKKGKGEARKPVVAPDSAQSKTYIKILYGLGEGEIEGLANGNQSIFLEGTPLQDANGNLNYSNVKLDFRKGTNDQDYIEGFPSVESETAVDVELKSGAPWVRAFNNIDLDAVRIRLKWGPLRQQDSSTGDVSGITIEYAIDIQTDGGAWTEVLKTKISDKTSANYERAHRIDLPKADSGWLIRVRRITPNSTSEFVSDKMYVEAFTEVVDAKLRYPNTALLGLQYDAETFGNVAKLAVDLKGRLLLVPTNYNPQTRQYTGIWDGTFKRAYTNNPAWIYYDLCTNDRYGLGNRLTPFMIDKWSLYRLAQYCDQSVSDGLGGQEPRFTCNVYIQNAEDAFSILMKLAGVFRAIAFWDGTSIICDADIPQDTYFTYTRANVVGGVFEYSGTRARDRHNVVKVAWDNPANHYKTEYEFVRDENAIAESGQVRILELDAWGCTSRGQAQRAGHWALKSEQKETRTVSFKVGLDGHIPLPGRVIEIADELFAGRANGGRVSKISADLKSITIDRDDVIAKAGDRLVINGENGKAQTRIVQSISGRVITVTLPFDENSIAVQNVWVLDAQDLATMKFRVISISQEEKHQFSITALQYNPQKFDEIDNGAFFEDAPISIINPSIQEPVKDVLITTESRVDQGINITTMIVSWMQAKGAVKYLVEWRKDDGSWIRLPQTGNNSVEVPGVYSGQYQARVTAISAFEIASLPVTSSLTEITGKQGLPPKIAFIRATGILFGMKLDWGFPPTGAKDTAYTEIEVSPDGINNIAQLGLFAYPTTTTTIQGLQPNLRQFYRGRLIDRIGNVGPWSEWVNGTTTADPEAVLDLISGHINESDLAQELQGKIENSVDVSEAAQAAANNAQAVASSAQTAANNAQAVASEAKTAASSAQSAATTAQTQASSAQKIANDASVIATNAKNTADQAAEDASSAITAAAEAKTTATNANTTATNAQTTANNASSAASKVASDLTTSTNQLNKKIADETDARTAAISKLNDGLTTETSQRKSEDAALLNNIETYKSSTNGTLSSLQTQINTNATNTSANTSKITSLDSRLTTNEGKTADAINAAATAQQVANTAVTNAAAAASAVTSLKSELSTGKGINNIIAPFSDPQELSPYIIGASRTVALVNSPMRINGKAYDVTFNAVAGSIYFGSSSVSTVNTAAAGVVSGGKRYMLSAYLKNIDPTKQAEVYFTLHWFKRTSEGAYSATQTVLINQATNTTRVTPSNEGGTVSCKAVAAPPDAVAFVVICSGNSVYNVAGSRILIDMLMLEEVVGVDVPASTWTAGPADLSAIKSALDANASAISNLKTRVTNAEGVITSQGNSITQLNNSVTSINSELTKKADATTLNALTNRVSTAEGTITSQGNSITSLRNDLNATNDKVASKADSSALNSLDSKVSEIDGRVTSNTSAVTALQGRVTTVENGLLTKADASALNNYYTKTEADSATSGAIDKFNSQLTIGGVNVVANSEAPRTSTAATNREYLLYERSAELKAFYDENLEKPITISFEMSVPVAGPVQVYSSNGSAHQFVTSVNAVIVNQFAKYSVTVSPKAHTASTTVSTIEFYGTYGTGRIPTIRKLQIEAGTKATAWSPSPRDTKAAIDANASAISKIDTRVTNAEGTITSQGNSITQLNNSVTSINGELTKKADATALNALTNRVSTAEGIITSQGNSITSLRNDLNATNDKVSSKADSSALNSLDSKVTSIDGRVTSNTSAVTSLQGRVSTVEGGLSSKADASALSNYYTKTEADAATSSAINSFNSQLTIGGVNAVANSKAPRTSTAATNREYLLYERSAELKAFYDENLEKPITISFEMSVPVAGPVQVYSSNGSAHQFVTSVNAIIVNQFAKYSVTVSPKAHTASTTVSTIEFYGTYGTGRIPTIRKLQIEAGTKATAWSPSPRDTKAAIDANASAIQTTQTKVDNIDGRLTTATDSITSLNSRMSTAEGNINSTNTAVGGLSTRMATAEGKITNQSDSIASLQNSVTSINGTLANKADSSAVNNLTSRVETAEGKISSQSGQITSLSNSLDLTNSNLNDVNVLARLLSLGKPLRDDPTFKLGMGGLAPYALQSGSTLTRQAVSADNPTESTYEVLLRATTTLGSGWYPNNPTVLGGPNKAFLVKQVIKMPTGQRVYPYNNPLGTGGFVRMLGNAEGTGKFETYYSIIQCGPDASKSIQGHFRVINSTTPPVPTTSNPVDVILASYEVFDVTAVNDTIPKAYSDAISANANAINSLSNSVTQQGNTITSHSNSITSLNNSITSINSSLTNKADASALNNLSNRVTAAEGNITSQGNSITSLNNTLTNNDLSNLVLNPDFIDPKNGWTSGVIVDATDAAPNPPSLKALKLNNRDSYYGPFVKCNVGDMFYVSAWFATPNTSATASAVIGFNTRNSAGTYTWYTVAVKSTDKNAWGFVEGYFTVPAGMVDIRPWLQVSIAASEAAGQQWHVTNIQVRNITGNKKLATDLQATSSALSTLDSKVTNIDGRVTSASNSIVSLNNSVTNINTALSQKADAAALNSLSNRVTTAEGNITSQGNSITSLTNSLAVSGKGGTNLLIKSNVVGTYDGISYPHHTYKLGEDWEIGATYTLIWCAEHKRGTGDTNSSLAVYEGGGSQHLQAVVNTNGKVVSKVTFVKNSAVASGPIIHFYMLNRPTADKGSVGTVYWAVLVKGDVLTTDAWIPSAYDYIPDSNANASAITNLTNTVTQQGNTLTSHTNSITSLNNSITSINGVLNTKANTSAVSDLDSRVTDAEGKITANTSSITSLTANLKSTSNGITMSASIDVDPDSEWIYWTKNGEVVRADDTSALGGKVYRFGNNAGNDHVNARSKAKLPFDQNKTYRIRARYRRVSGTGTIYCAVFGIAKDGVSHVNSSNTVTTDAGSSNYFVTNQAPALNAWQEVTVYVKGRAAGAATGGWTLDNPRQLPNATAFISVQFLANYSSAAGEVDLDYLIIEDADAIAANDATAKALSSLDTRVTTAEGKITSQGNSITQLNNSITTINGTLSTKADSSALTNLANRVTTAENSITSQGSSITSLNSSVTGILKDIEVTDTRSTNQPPSWYWSNYPKRIVREFKQASTIGLSGMGTYVSLETYVYYSDATGGPIIQIARGTDSKLTAERRSTSTSTWGTWVQDIKAISDGLANKAEASALSSLDSKVSVIDGKVSTQASSITTLQTTVGGNTASIQSQQQSIDGLKARATLKLQSGNLVGGVGIENDSKTVDFIIQANKFAIGAPSDVTSAVTPKYAFTYQSTPTTLPNGTVIPAGLYLDSASISYINANKIYADSLSAISANLGTFTSLADQSKPNGARTVISGERIEVYDENNVMRVRIGRW
ncbi:phage tail protein [Acinetobacter baumannii]|uniref:TipJ family phage tail tip protein n=1 Tax=Acinetobacter baumannii TaxID=470 RepID=UPI00044DDBEB|nr:phage tail protein [Acinetobacter baumannii]EXE65571.1 slyX family protein [Acinetobacter baumannii 1552865]EXS79841.1 slyX family protein [Acinetobacter baumannii 45002_6]EXS84509.1 slyX family protein [Acinetobacter baumannii 45002_5]EXS91885.1 slyX family protein [Acinetobacter baumannii 45002_3]EXS98168.1 slyX family protein [Acinetobacter baumannii 45002_10]